MSDALKLKTAVNGLLLGLLAALTLLGLSSLIPAWPDLSYLYATALSANWLRWTLADPAQQPPDLRRTLRRMAIGYSLMISLVVFATDPSVLSAALSLIMLPALLGRDLQIDPKLGDA